jgi:hypothetical protein
MGKVTDYLDLWFAVRNEEKFTYGNQNSVFTRMLSVFKRVTESWENFVLRKR